MHINIFDHYFMRVMNFDHYFMCVKLIDVHIVLLLLVACFCVFALCVCISYHLGCSRIAYIIQERVAVAWFRPCRIELAAIGRGARSRSVGTSF